MGSGIKGRLVATAVVAFLAGGLFGAAGVTAWAGHGGAVPGKTAMMRMCEKKVASVRKETKSTLSSYKDADDLLAFVSPDDVNDPGTIDTLDSYAEGSVSIRYFYNSNSSCSSDKAAERTVESIRRSSGRTGEEIRKACYAVLDSMKDQQSAKWLAARSKTLLTPEQRREAKER